LRLAETSGGRVGRTAAPALPALRRRLFEILERGRGSDITARIFDTAIIALILLNVLGSVIETVPWINARYEIELSLLDRFCVTIFILEYIGRLWTAPEHPALRGLSPTAARLRVVTMPLMMIDFVAIMPFFIEPFAGVDLTVIRVLRVVRFYRLARYVPALATISRVIAAEWRPLMGSVVLFIGLLLITGVLMYIAEGSVQPDRLGDVPSAMWWAVVTLSTVGYGDIVPVTAFGKFIAALTMVFGILFMALPVGIIASGFQQEIRRRDFVVTFAMVARVPLFAALEVSTIARLVGILRALKISSGSDIVTRGEPADGMYFIASGEVEIILSDRRVTLSEGDFFGEIALLKPDAKRTATVVATRSCELLKLEQRDFQGLLERHFDLADALGEIARRRVEEFEQGGLSDPQS
jgi:voltage-gated potassium channel